VSAPRTQVGRFYFIFIAGLTLCLFTIRLRSTNRDDDERPRHHIETAAAGVGARDVSAP
jgi:hypothetical protein